MLGLTNNFKQRGIIPRAVQQVFNSISQKFDQAITIKISYVEIYNERVSKAVSNFIYFLDDRFTSTSREYWCLNKVTCNLRWF